MSIIYCTYYIWNFTLMLILMIIASALFGNLMNFGVKILFTAVTNSWIVDLCTPNWFENYSILTAACQKILWWCNFFLYSQFFSITFKMLLLEVSFSLSSLQIKVFFVYSILLSFLVFTKVSHQQRLLILASLFLGR